MKKMTKVLVALAAMAILLIGATTTVCAAEISRWDGNEKEGYVAYDENDELIVRGWGKSESGRWYYFASGKMTTNRIITDAGATYYVGEDGAMHTGWKLFSKDDILDYNGAAGVTIADIFGDTVGTGTVFNEDDERYEKVWCYFDEKGKMVKDSWIKVNDIWYYIDNAYCLIDERSIELEWDGDKDYYGFGPSGSMYAGWIADEISPEEIRQPQSPTEEVVIQKATVAWYYYGKDGKQKLNGWKEIDNEWFYFENGVALSDTYLSVDGYNFYFDESCYMSRGEVTLTSKPVFKEVVDGEMKVATGSSITVSSSNPVTLTFDSETGILNLGLINGTYYENLEGGKYKVITSTSNSTVSVTLETIADKMLGQKWTGEFMYVYTNEDGDTVVNYFINGAMVKSEALFFGDKILAFDKDGNLVSTSTKIGRETYTKSTEALDSTLGIYFSTYVD